MRQMHPPCLSRGESLFTIPGVRSLTEVAVQLRLGVSPIAVGSCMPLYGLYEFAILAIRITRQARSAQGATSSKFDG